MSTVIQLEFLQVDEGETFLVDLPDGSSAEDLAYVIRNNLHQGGIVLAEVYIDHVIKRGYDDPINMLMTLTDPGELHTVEDAGQILSEAEAQGWNLDPQLTPEDILAIYNDLEPEEK